MKSSDGPVTFKSWFKSYQSMILEWPFKKEQHFVILFCRLQLAPAYAPDMTSRCPINFTCPPASYPGYVPITPGMFCRNKLS